MAAAAATGRQDKSGDAKPAKPIRDRMGVRRGEKTLMRGRALLTTIKPTRRASYGAILVPLRDAARRTPSAVPMATPQPARHHRRRISRTHPTPPAPPVLDRGTRPCWSSPVTPAADASCCP
jgi:hypothetical protein